MSRNTTEPIAVRASTAAEMLDCSRQFVYKLMESGRLGRVHIAGSKSVRIPVEDVYSVLGLEAPEHAAPAGDAA